MKRLFGSFILSPSERGAKAYAALVLALVFMLGGCVPLSRKQVKKELFAMDTFISLSAYGEGADEGLEAVSEEIERLDGLLSATDAESELYKLNASESGPFSVSGETFGLIREALGISEKLGGAIELSIRPVLLAWGFTTGEYRIPSEEELEELLKLVDDGRIELDESNLTVTMPDGMQLDLGAVAKGYACDRAAETLEEAGVSSYLLDLGASTVMARGTKPDGGKWRIALRDPEGEGYAGVIETDGAVVSTSGGTERYFTGEDGEIYWHIIDPATGLPAKNGLVSVTVITENALWGDALSTALFVMGIDKTEEYYKAEGGFEYVMITEDGRLLLSPGAEAVFTPLGRFAEGGTEG